MVTIRDDEGELEPAVLSVHSLSTVAQAPIRVATLNVRYDGRQNNPVSIPSRGAVDPEPRHGHQDKHREQPWAVRRSRMVDALLSTGQLDILGFQEVYHSQLEDLAELLGPAYDHVGVGRDDGKKAGEYSPIFYDRTRFERVGWKTVWLSPTPEVPGSVGWDASQTRIATLLTLRERSGAGLVHVANTHYDDRGLRARANSSTLIRAVVRRWVDDVEGMVESSKSAPTAPVIFFGDFNSPPEEDGYRIITSRRPLPGGTPSHTFLDAFCHLHARAPGVPGRQSRPYGPLTTYTGFAAPGRERTQRIDFVFLAAADSLASGERPDQVSPDAVRGPAVGRGGWAFTQYGVIDNWVEEGDADGFEGRWSDHRAVRATVART